MGRIMDALDDYFFGPINFIDRGEGLIRRAIYRDSAVKFSYLRMDHGGTHSRQQLIEILAKYGIPAFGHTHDSHCLHFLVKSRQAVWAEYLLVHAGVDLQNPPVDPRNYSYPAKHPSGWMPTPWSERENTTGTAHGGNDEPVKSVVDKLLYTLGIS